jgi:hypothetical protein
MWSALDGVLLFGCLGVTLLSIAVACRLLLASKRIRWQPTLSDSCPSAPVTVIIPARNEEHDLAPALQSILDQAGVNLEVIVTAGFAWGIMPRLATPGLRNGSAATAYAVGAFLLVRRTAFEAVGGFADLKADVCDDIGLARRLKQSGYRVGFRAAPELLTARLFKSNSDAFWGPTKNVLSRLRGRYWLAPAFLLGIMALFWTSLVAITLGVWQGHPTLLLAGIVAYIAQYASLWPSRWLFHFHPAKALLFPLAILSLCCCLTRAMYHYTLHGTVIWKGRAVQVRGGPV